MKNQTTPTNKDASPFASGFGAIKIPSEMLEPIVTKTLGELMECFALGSYTYKEMDDRIWGLAHFVDNCGAIHCSLSITNFQRMIWRFQDKPEELRKMFRDVAIKHF